MESIAGKQIDESPSIAAGTDVEQGIAQSTPHESAADAIVGDHTKQSGKRLRNICIVALTLFVAFGCVLGLYKWCKLSNGKPVHKNTSSDETEGLSQSDGQNIQELSLLVLGKTEQDRRNLLKKLGIANSVPLDKLETGIEQYSLLVKHNSKLLYRLKVYDYFNNIDFVVLSGLLKTVNAAVIVYDISERTSFEDARHCNLKNDELSNEKPIVFLVGSKSNQMSMRQISYEEGSELATQNGWKFFETTGDKATSIETIKMTILSDLYAQFVEPSASQE